MNQILAPLQHVNVDTEAVRKDERHRIAQELYDQLGEQMLVLHMSLVRLFGNINQTYPDVQEAATLAMNQLGQLMRSMLTLTRCVRPAVLDRGFCSAVEWQCEQSSRRFVIPCHLAWSASNISLRNHQSLILLRALQEALNNVHHHSKASRVYVVVNSDDKNVALTVVDDGVGIALGNQAESSFYQLAGLKERIIDLGGKVSLLSAHNSGVALNIELPIGGRWS